MNISEKLYLLRKKSSLSQEQLAEELNVSRQAISKWESGISVPESEKLIAISNYFGVSVDYLLKDAENDTKNEAKKTDSIFKYIGLSFCISGFLLLILWGILMIANPAFSGNVAESSVITLDGRAILLTACLALVALGAVLLLKKRR